MKTLRLRVMLLDVQPELWRVVDVPAASTLPELHELLQSAVGWTDSHLHEFAVGQLRWGVPDPDWEDDVLDEQVGRLRDLGPAFSYRYDFGDGWEHTVEVVGRGGEQPGCVDGNGACPPEDCGGPHGYEELLAALADPGHEEHDELTAWAGPRLDFDLAETDAVVRRTVGIVPGSVRVLLDLLQGGVKLTPAGNLPRSVVQLMQQSRPAWAWDPGTPAQREVDLIPLWALHELLRDVGLARLAKGVLRPTKAADDDLEVVRRLRTAFPESSFGYSVCQVAMYLLLTRGALAQPELAVEVLALLGRGWQAEGRPLTPQDVSHQLSSLWASLRGLDLIEGEGVWQAGPAARTLLAHTARLPERAR